MQDLFFLLASVSSVVMDLFNEANKYKKGGVIYVFCGYLRFLNSFRLSISVMYSKPSSIRFLASVMLLAVLHVHSSSSRFNSCV